MITFTRMSSCLVIWLVSGNSSRHSFIEKGHALWVTVFLLMCVFLSVYKRQSVKQQKSLLTSWCVLNICMCVCKRDWESVRDCDAVECAWCTVITLSGMWLSWELLTLGTWAKKLLFKGQLPSFYCLLFFPLHVHHILLGVTFLNLTLPQLKLSFSFRLHYFKPVKVQPNCFINFCLIKLLSCPADYLTLFNVHIVQHMSYECCWTGFFSFVFLLSRV